MPLLRALFFWNFSLSKIRHVVAIFLIGALFSCSHYEYDAPKSSVAFRLTSGFLTNPSPFNSDSGNASNESGWGKEVVTLSNGNFVAVDSLDSTVAEQAGAVHLYSGETHELINSY